MNLRRGNTYVRIIETTSAVYNYLKKINIQASVMQIDIAEPVPVVTLAYSRGLDRLRADVLDSFDGGDYLEHKIKDLRLQWWRPVAANNRRSPAFMPSVSQTRH